MEIAGGYRLHLVTADGELLDTLELDGYDLGKPMAQVNLCSEIESQIRLDMEAKRG